MEQPGRGDRHDFLSRLKVNSFSMVWISERFKFQSRFSTQFWMKPNRRTLPLKLVIFFFACSSFSFIPYLTVHMKDIGITVEDIALIYLILPFANLVSNPLTGERWIFYTL